MAYYRRSSWTSTSNRAVSVKRKQVHTTLHYPGWGTNSIRTANWSLERCFQQLRAWRNMHVGSGAYREVAYSLYALPTGDVAEGRGNRQNGANGNSTANRAGMSIQVLIGDNEPLSQGHLNGLFAALALVESWHPGSTKRQYGHSHWVSTACPGRHVRAGIPYRVGGKPSTGSGGGAPKPPVKADPNRQWRTSPRVAGFSTARVREIQRELVDAGYSVGSHGIDGSYGDATGAAVKALQTDLEITADGIYGPGTEKALMSMKDDVAFIRRVTVENQKRIDDTWSYRGIDYVSPEGTPSTKDHQVSRAHQYAFEAPTRVWAHRGRDYVNEENPSTADHQIARAHQYSFSAHLTSQRIEAQVKGLNAAVSAMAESQGLDPARIEEIVQTSVDGALADLSITLTADNEDDEG